MGKKWDKLMGRIEALEKALGLGGKTPKASKPKPKKKPKAKKAVKPAAKPPAKPKPKKKARRAKKALPPVPAIIPGL
jgi:hypothetical protein